jgi:carbon dioxide concentrating mechanism protein CcmL
MTIGRIAGTVVSAVNSVGIPAARFLLVEDSNPKGEGRKDFLVALDLVGAERGQLVLLSQGSSCHWSHETKEKPIDALVVAIVEAVDSGPETLYRA